MSMSQLAGVFGVFVFVVTVWSFMGLVWTLHNDFDQDGEQAPLSKWQVVLLGPLIWLERYQNRR